MKKALATGKEVTLDSQGKVVVKEKQQTYSSPAVKAVENEKMSYPRVEKVKALQPGGPKYNRFFFMQYLNNRLYTTGGAFEPGAIGLNQPGTIQVLKNGEWDIYQDELDKITG